MGQLLASTFSLVGLFGVDHVLQNDEPWVVEINPRYTASVEILELAVGRSLLAEHVSACLGEYESSPPPTRSISRRRLPRVAGKTILYADRSLVAPEIEIHGFRDRTRSRFPP